MTVRFPPSRTKSSIGHNSALLCGIFSPSQKQKKGPALRDKPRTEQFGEDFVIQHPVITGLAEWGTTFVAVVRKMFTY